jgi:hypothetical protein
MTEALQPAGNNLPAVYDEQDYGFGNEISAEGLQLPLIKLCQKSTREKPNGVTDGDFYNASTGKNLGKTITMHVFRSYRGRVKFTPDYKLECKSDDAICGQTYGKCATCQFSKWIDDRELRKKNYCAPVVTFLAVLEGEVIPGLLGLSKVRETAANKINSQLKFLIIENKTLPQAKRNPIYFYKIKLTSFQEEVNGEKIYNIKHELVGLEQDPERKAILVGLFREWKEFSNDISKVEGGASEAEPAQAAKPQESKAF